MFWCTETGTLFKMTDVLCLLEIKRVDHKNVFGTLWRYGRFSSKKEVRHMADVNRSLHDQQRMVCLGLQELTSPANPVYMSIWDLFDLLTVPTLLQVSLGLDSSWIIRLTVRLRHYPLLWLLTLQPFLGQHVLLDDRKSTSTNEVWDIRLILQRILLRERWSFRNWSFHRGVKIMEGWTSLSPGLPDLTD